LCAWVCVCVCVSPGSPWGKTGRGGIKWHREIRWPKSIHNWWCCLFFLLLFSSSFSFLSLSFIIIYKSLKEIADCKVQLWLLFCSVYSFISFKLNSNALTPIIISVLKLLFLFSSLFYFYTSNEIPTNLFFYKYY